MQPNQPVGHIISPNPSVPIFEDFMNNYPKKTICALNETTEVFCYFCFPDLRLLVVQS